MIQIPKIKKIDFNFINKPNLIVARHIWEHFYDQSKFIELLKIGFLACTKLAVRIFLLFL